MLTQNELRKQRIGRVVRRLRNKHRLSQAELGEMMNVRQTAISHIELGRKFPSMSIAIRLAEYFGVSLDEFVTEDEKEAA